MAARLPELFFYVFFCFRAAMTYRTVRIGVAYRLGTLASADSLLWAVSASQK